MPSFFSHLKLSDHIGKNRAVTQGEVSEKTPFRTSMVAAVPRKRPPTTAHEISDLQKRIDCRDGSLVNVQVVSAFLVASLSIKQFIKDDYPTLNLVLECLNVIIPAATVLTVTILQRQRDSALKEIDTIDEDLQPRL